MTHAKGAATKNATREVFVRVRIYHNVARDPKGRRIHFCGYEPGHPLVLVLEAAIDLVRLGEVFLPEAIFVACNAEVHELGGSLRDLARAYRDRRLRSLSVGDVLVIGDDEDRKAMQVIGNGFSFVPAESLNTVHHPESGTQPWPADTPPIQV